MRTLLKLLLFVALIGAPFGMGRMMDHAHQTVAADGGQIDHGTMHHGKVPMHDAAKPHFVACAACASIPADVDLSVLDFTVTASVALMPPTILHGKSLLPDLPPPRA